VRWPTQIEKNREAAVDLLVVRVRSLASVQPTLGALHIFSGCLTMTWGAATAAEESSGVMRKESTTSSKMREAYAVGGIFVPTDLSPYTSSPDRLNARQVELE
jgi:hypothetical protein